VDKKDGKRIKERKDDKRNWKLQIWSQAPIFSM